MFFFKILNFSHANLQDMKVQVGQEGDESGFNFRPQKNVVSRTNLALTHVLISVGKFSN